MTDASSRSSTVPYSAPTLVGALCIALIMTGTLVSACDSGGNDGEQADVLIPIEVGNEWTADATDERGDLEPRTGTLSAEITDTEKVSVAFAELSGTVGIGREEDDVVIDLSRFYEGEGFYDGGSMRLRYPVETGTTYQFTDTENRQFQVEVSRESVSVPAGSYDCLLYEIVESPPGEVSRRIWVKPGVGPVKFTATDITVELTSTNVNS